MVVFPMHNVPRETMEIKTMTTQARITKSRKYQDVKDCYALLEIESYAIANGCLADINWNTNTVSICLGTDSTVKVGEYDDEKEIRYCDHGTWQEVSTIEEAVSIIYQGL